MMTRNPRIQGLQALRREMSAVARGARPAPVDAAQPSFESVDALIRLLTPENRHLLATIRNCQPGSIAELSALTGRAQPNLTRTLAKLRSAGLVTMHSRGRKKVPAVAVQRLVVTIDPCSEDDSITAH